MPALYMGIMMGLTILFVILAIFITFYNPKKEETKA